MSYNELAAVKEFTLWNEHGKIKFLQPVDLRCLDIAAEFRINHGYIIIHPTNVGRFLQHKAELTC